MCKICPKLTIMTSSQWRRFVPSLLTFKRFHTLFYCFHCWLWPLNKEMLYAIPHNFFRSVDSLIWPSIRNKTVPRWHQGIIKFQVGFSGISIVNSMRQLATPHFYRFFLKCHRGVSSTSTRGSEFSSYEIVLRNRVTQIDFTLWVINWKFFYGSSLELLKY